MRALQLILVLALIGPMTPGLMPAHGAMPSPTPAAAAPADHAAPEANRCCGAGTEQTDCDLTVALLPTIDAVGALPHAGPGALPAAPRYRSPAPDGRFRPPTA